MINDLVELVSFEIAVILGATAGYIIAFGLIFIICLFCGFIRSLYEKVKAKFNIDAIGTIEDKGNINPCYACSCWNGDSEGWAISDCNRRNAYKLKK